MAEPKQITIPVPAFLANIPMWAIVGLCFSGGLIVSRAYGVGAESVTYGFDGEPTETAATWMQLVIPLLSGALPIILKWLKSDKHFGPLIEFMERVLASLKRIEKHLGTLPPEDPAGTGAK